MVIYIDIILIENILMNYIIFLATTIILKKKIRYFKIFISSLIGSLYAVIGYVTRISIYFNIISKIILSIIMVYIAYNPKDIKETLKDLILFYLTTFTFGGVATYLIYVIKPHNIVIKNGVYDGSYILKIIFIGAILGSILLVIAFKFVKNKINRKDLICQIKITMNHKEKEIKAMIDTGNMLKEPITGKPVIVVEYSCLYNFISKEILNNIERILGGNFENIPEKIKNEYIGRLKIIPFSSLGKQNGLLLGIKLDEFEVENYENLIKRNDVIMGIYNKSLTKYGEYNALIGTDLFK